MYAATVISSDACGGHADLTMRFEGEPEFEGAYTVTSTWFEDGELFLAVDYECDGEPGEPKFADSFHAMNCGHDGMVSVMCPFNGIVVEFDAS